MPAGESRAGKLALGCPWPGVGTMVLSAAVCAEDGNHDEINSKFRFSNFHPTWSPFKISSVSLGFFCS